MGKAVAMHGRDHRPGGADPTLIGWVQADSSDTTIKFANVIKFGTNMTVSTKGGFVIRVDEDGSG